MRQHSLYPESLRLVGSSCLKSDVFADDVVYNDIQLIAQALDLCVPLQQLL